MGTRQTIENRRDRLELATEAGYAKASPASVLAGVLVGYGAFAVVAAVVGGVLSLLGIDARSLSDNDWRQLGIASAAAAALSLFLSYLFGGYVAGRMARRSGALNGMLVFLVGIVLAAGVGAAIGTLADTDALTSNLRSIGVPTSSSEYSAIGTIAGLAALAAMFLGALLGGISGERWHGKLVSRAIDPRVGPDHPHDVETLDGGATMNGTSDVRSGDRHFLDGDRSAPATTAFHESTTLDEDRSAERTRTMH